MPENGNNNFNQNNDISNDIPKLNNDNFEMPKTAENNVQQENKPIIEIPQAYYDKLEKEQQEKMAAEKAERELKAEAAEALGETGKFLFFTSLNAIIIFGLFYITLNYFKFAVLGVPLIIFVLSIFGAVKDKEKSIYPSTLLVGGMLVAIVTFVLSMTNEESDMWMNYTIVSAGLGFLGMITSSIITNIISNYKNIKAIKGLGYILYFVLLIGAPIYLMNNYREEIYKYFFNEQIEVEAETETEFIIKTLKNRYNVEFTCGIYATQADADAKKLTYDKYNSKIDQFGRKYTERICQDSQKRDVVVLSKAYNESEVQYIVMDDYVDVLFLNTIKDSLSKDILNISSSLSVVSYLYPKENCNFYGDCADIQEYFDRYETESNIDNQYKVSTSLNLEKELNTKSLDYINSHQYKYVFKIVGSYNDVVTDYSLIVSNILNKLNSLGYKNTFGFEITILSTQDSGETEQVVYKVVGDTNEEQSFKNPEVVNISANK